MQNWQEKVKLKELWENVQDDNVDYQKFKKLEESILTRWWLIRACVLSFKEQH